MTGPGEVEPRPEDHRATVRLIRNALIALGIFVVGGIVVALSGDDSGERASDRGPLPGGSVQDYIASRHEVLAGLSGPQVAVVSFDDYVDEASARELVDLEVERFFVAAPTREPRVVTDVDQWRSETIAELDAEIQSFEELIPTVEDEEFVEQYRDDQETARQAIGALGAGGDMVFAVVVRGDAAVLGMLVGAPSIRLVDPVQAREDVKGLRPEERRLIGRPPVRP